MTDPATYFAPAKTNLGLSVLGVRPDGYHELHSLMVPLSVGDELTFRPAPALSLDCSGPYGAGLPTDGRNLVYRAARAYLDAAGVDAGVHITLTKRLPLASGLGGGSSDAATTLRALADLYPADLDLPALALTLGADVPFFLPAGPALAGGVGERLRPVTLPPAWLVLANPGSEVSAADAYRWLDESGEFSPTLNVPGIVRALEDGRELPYFNSLQPGVLSRHPEIEQTLVALADAGLHSVLMSGSGATCFGVARDAAQATAAAQSIQAQQPEWWVAAAQVGG
ncbi:4-(cytidine 5'-diphospho)-2-C-methyl-D-erythritol kinase [Deinococcus radiophilus]|uniref:4-diphosphocytidyl-2-C-methyl-D-erythritol kinase n=1 Tax=Deinococcus radiophilus TaxID=32062 RepID=A0A3S0I768_9DEIO|nr:4-(cytidine 5'-diphospho)-2-C-methyl-D-erythritol kinase [Deinococcus radiophilus]RTR29006.1 4-(cytidine 5'-diphospho)-2-C-methyl-D-erythritol kinase [Deinococcus radiophilus]UFA49590.1 4-(cytidine 5'-diphospho)-2-C-methyl-D-erythritol kinase [Deinococcus radiophilus]